MTKSTVFEAQNSIPIVVTVGHIPNIFILNVHLSTHAFCVFAYLSDFIEQL